MLNSTIPVAIREGFTKEVTFTLGLKGRVTVNVKDANVLSG